MTNEKKNCNGNMTRPLDTLNEMRDKRVVVKLKNGITYVGELKSFDIHINVSLKNVEEIKDDKTVKNLDRVFIRGDTIITVF